MKLWKKIFIGIAIALCIAGVVAMVTDHFGKMILYWVLAFFFGGMTEPFNPKTWEQYQAEQQVKSERNAIIKGAVIGGIVAGDAGAVVGAAAAKNKIDNEKKS